VDQHLWGGYPVISQDYQTNCRLAQAYFDEVEAPHKKLCIMKDTTHGLLESKPEAFSEILYETAREQDGRQPIAPQRMAQS